MSTEIRIVEVRDLAQCPFRDGVFTDCTLDDGPEPCDSLTAGQYPADCPIASEGAILVRPMPLITQTGDTNG
jgi:hypothetical protein